MSHAIIPTHGQPPERPQAAGDAQLIALWLHGKSRHSQRAYTADIKRLLAALPKPLAEITLGDLQAFADSQAGLGANSRKRVISSVKSLFSFAQKLGYLRFNVAAALKTPAAKDELAQRILSEAEVHAMLGHTRRQRDRVLLRVLYASAGRVSEVCALTWADVQPNGDSGQITVFGKGGKTRAIKFSKATWQVLQTYRGSLAAAGPEDPIFSSQKGGHLDASQVHRIVRSAAKRAGIAGNVSPHWLRHSHASHALDRGASVVLVRDTLGHSSLAITSRYAHAKPNESSALHLGL